MLFIKVSSSVELKCDFEIPKFSILCFLKIRFIILENDLQTQFQLPQCAHKEQQSVAIVSICKSVEQIWSVVQRLDENEI